MVHGSTWTQPLRATQDRGRAFVPAEPGVVICVHVLTWTMFLP